MTWFFWIIISVITTAGLNIFQRIVMRDDNRDPYGTNLIFCFLTGVTTLLFALWHGFVLPPIGTHFWNFLISAAFWGFGSLFLFYAYKTLGSSEVAILSALGGVVTILASVFLLGETFTVQRAVGTIFIISSIWLVNQKKDLSFFGKGTVYALISTLLFGLAVTNDTFILRTYDSVSYTPLAFLFPSLLLVLIRPKSIRSFSRLTDVRYSKNMFFLVIFYAVQAITYYIALQMSGVSSQIAPISRSSIILTVILAVIFLKEKDKLFLKFLSAILVTVGVLLIK